MKPSPTHLGSIYIALHVAIVLRKHSASLLTTPQRVPTDYGTPIHAGRLLKQSYVVGFFVLGFDTLTLHPTYNAIPTMRFSLTLLPSGGLISHDNFLSRVVYWVVKERASYDMKVPKRRCGIGLD
jgi:hypothetical protein